MSPNLKSRILIPLAVIFLGLALAFVATFQRQEQHKHALLKQDSLTSVALYYDVEIAARSRKMIMLGEAIIEPHAIKQALKTNDRKALLDALSDGFKRDRERWQITHLYFHDVEGVNLLRLHQPERYGDLIERHTMKQAIATGEIAAGVELGVLGTLTLRMVMPVHLDERLIGFIELGEEVADIYESIAAKLGINLFLLLDETLVTTETPETAPQFVDTKPDWELLPGRVVYRFCNCEMPQYLQDVFSLADDASIVEAEFKFQQTHLFAFVPLRDAADKVIGRLIIDRDVTQMVDATRKELMTVALAALLGWLLLCAIFYRVLKRFETDWARSKVALHRKEASLANAQRMARLSDWHWNLTSRYLTCSDEFLELLGLKRGQAPRTFDDLIGFIHVEDREKFRQYFDRVRRAEEEGDLLHRLNVAGQVETWVRHRAQLLCTIEEKDEFVQAVAQDVTQQYRIEAQAARLGHILKYSWNEIYLFDAQSLKFIEVSEGAMRNLGYALEELRAMTPLDLKPLYEEKEFRQLLLPLRMGAKDYLLFETVQQRKDGSRYPVEVRLQYSADATPPCYIAIMQDISERKRYLNELEHKALYDEMTGLPNRMLFCDRVRAQIKRMQRDNTAFAVVLVDINRLREVNDSLNYEVGNSIIKQVAERLVQALRDSDVVGHLGGGIFALLLPLDEGAKIEPLLHKLSLALRRPLPVEGLTLDVDVTLGTALCPLHGQDDALLLRCADSALQHAKVEKLGSFVFSAKSQPFSIRRLRLVAELRAAVESGQLELHYQPKINSADGRVESAEALLRWPRSDGEMISPAEFVPLAEQTGLIRPLTLLVLEQGIRQCAEWRSAGIVIKIAINLSVRNLTDANLTEYIDGLLSKYQVPAEAIMLEITETAMMQHPEQGREVIHKLHERGFQIAIDDYGTGYSSLVYLKQLPVAELKIDQNFIRDMLTSEDDAVIVHSTIELAHNMGLKVVAEGVETAEICAALRRQGCDVIQGYFVSRPLAAARFEAWYRQNGGVFSVD